LKNISDRFDVKKYFFIIIVVSPHYFILMIWVDLPYLLTQKNKILLFIKIF